MDLERSKSASTVGGDVAADGPGGGTVRPWPPRVAASTGGSVLPNPRREPDDLGELITLQRAAFLAEAHIYGHPRLPPMQETVEEARQVLADPVFRVHVAEIDQPRSRIVGSVRAKPAGVITEVGRLATVPDLLGRGIGGSLLQHVHDTPASSTEEFELYTGARSTGNHRLYAAHGYRSLRTFIDSEGVEVIIMRRPVLVNAADRPRPQVCVYVTHDDSLLVFEHRDQPAGVQVPAGGIAPGESVRAAAEREVFEETGLAVRFTGMLGYEDSPIRRLVQRDARPTSPATLLQDRPSGSWAQPVTGQAGDTGQVLVCRFAPLRQNDLGEDHHAFLSVVLPNPN